MQEYDTILHAREILDTASKNEEQIKKALTEIISLAGVEYINGKIKLANFGTKIMETSSRFNIESFPDDEINAIVNVKRINDIRYLNKFFEAVNKKLPRGGNFICCGETIGLRKERILNKFIKPVSYTYYFFDFIIKRVFPKWNVSKKIYFFLTRGQNRVLSLPEILGRLVSCGFEIIDYKKIKGLVYFVTKKISKPVYDMKPSYGPIFKMKRSGKDGKLIYVYKLRTMHPYAEYLQDYIFKLNNLDQGGKFKDDFRITHWGRIFRKLWIDELPMLINWIKRDLKLVGVRPLSYQYLNLYTPELRAQRIRFKPGLIPPYYADMPNTLEEIMASEIKYLDEYEKHPFRTDCKYFCKAFINITLKHARSS